MTEQTMNESATLKIAKCGTEIMSTTWPRPNAGGRNSRSVRLPSTPPASPPSARAQRLHDEHVAAGEQRSTELVAEAEATAARLVSDAEEQKARTLEALAVEKAGLEGEVEQLRSFETDYRSRLTSYIEGQLREIRAQKRVEPPTPAA